MGGIAGIVRWDSGPVRASEIRGMIHRVRHRGPDGINWEVEGRVGLAYGGLAMAASESPEPQPVWLPDKSCGIVADARLYNREFILSRLGKVCWLNERPSDAAVLLAAYERWDEGLLDLLDGDFAFAIWDRRRERVFAARDPFAARPFFYWFDKKRFVFGSEPKQLLMLPRVPLELDDIVIGEYLLGGSFEDIEHTCFKHISRLKPASYLIATRNGLGQRRYWNPDPENEIHYSTHSDYLEHLRDLVLDAVAKRSTSDFPVAAQLSGGLDSSSIVVAAAELYEKGCAALPPFKTISALYPSLPCDESQYIQAVVEKVPFDSYMINPLSEPLTDGLAHEMRLLDAPFVDLHRGLFVGCARIMNQTAAKTLLTGLGGDELFHEEFYLRDLALRKQFLLLLSESVKASKTSWNSLGWLFFDAMRPVVPKAVKRLRRMFRTRGRWRPPDWANPSFVAFFRTCPEPPILPDIGFKSLTQEMAFKWINYPDMTWVTEGLDCLGAFHGFSVLHPFLDRPLAEYVLAIPFEERIPGGQWKYLLSEGLAAQLPDRVRHRTRKTLFDSARNHLMHQWRSELAEILFGSREWFSERYVIRKEAMALFESSSQSRKMESVSMELWRLTTLELWLRQLSHPETKTELKELHYG